MTPTDVQTITLTQAIVAWAEKDPAAAALAFLTISGSIVGSLGDLLARIISEEKHPTWWNLAKAMQNAGIAWPTFGQRLLLAAKGLKAPEPPPPGAP